MTKLERRPSRRAGNRAIKVPDPELRQLRVFVTLVDRGTMSAAARALGVAQSTVSEVVDSLERVLGTRLVSRRRGAHDIALTPAGEALLPHARGLLVALQDAKIAVAAVDRAVRGSVEVIANESISTYLLPRALRELRSRWPNMRFAVTTGMCPDITDGLSTGRYDVGLMLQTGSCESTAAREGVVFLTEIPLIVFSAAAHPLAPQPSELPIQRERLAPYTLFVSDSRGHFHDLVRDFFHADGLPGPRLAPTGSVEAVKQSVATDPRGLGVLPAYALSKELHGGLLRALALQPEVPRVRLEAMVYRTRAPAHPAVAALLDVLRQEAPLS
jgi:DNA-binding transcriptional LysR family regulator